MGDRITEALTYAHKYASIDGSHHKAWVIDQMVRALTGCPVVQVQATDSKGHQFTYPAQDKGPEYVEFIRSHNDGEDGPDTYEWDEGIAP